MLPIAVELFPLDVLPTLATKDGWHFDMTSFPLKIRNIQTPYVVKVEQETILCGKAQRIYQIEQEAGKS